MLTDRIPYRSCREMLFRHKKIPRADMHRIILCSFYPQSSRYTIFQKYEMTLDCFIVRSSSFFTNSDHPQSRVISESPSYLTSFLYLTFIDLTRCLLRGILPFLLPESFPGVSVSRDCSWGLLPVHWYHPSCFLITL